MKARYIITNFPGLLACLEVQTNSGQTQGVGHFQTPIEAINYCQDSLKDRGLSCDMLPQRDSDNNPQWVGPWVELEPEQEREAA